MNKSAEKIITAITGANPTLLVRLTLNEVYRAYLELANVDVEQRDADGNILQVRNDAKYTLRYQLKNEVDLFYRQTYGNVVEGAAAAQYSAKQRVDYWSAQRDMRVQQIIDTGDADQAGDDRRLARILANLDREEAYFNLCHARFVAAKDFYEEVLEEPYKYEPFTTGKSSAKSNGAPADKASVERVLKLLRKDAQGNLRDASDASESAPEGSAPWAKTA